MVIKVSVINLFLHHHVLYTPGPLHQRPQPPLHPWLATTGLETSVMGKVASFLQKGPESCVCRLPRRLASWGPGLFSRVRACVHRALFRAHIMY